MLKINLLLFKFSLLNSIYDRNYNSNRNLIHYLMKRINFFGEKPELTVQCMIKLKTVTIFNIFIFKTLSQSRIAILDPLIDLIRQNNKFLSLTALK